MDGTNPHHINTHKGLLPLGAQVGHASSTGGFEPIKRVALI